MTSRIVFSEAAREDRRNITSYTVERFGIGQARRLRDRFQQVLTTLADNPQMGPSLTESQHRFAELLEQAPWLLPYWNVKQNSYQPDQFTAAMGA